MGKQHQVDEDALIAIIGEEPGRAVVQTINTFHPMRGLRDMVAAGKLDLSLAVVRRAITQMVPAVLTAPQARALLAAGKD